MRRDINTLCTIAISALLASCGTSADSYDATGIFEATEITVSAEQNGRLLQFTPEEGDAVDAGQQIALIDTTQLYIKALQVGAAKLVYQSQMPDIQTQIAATRQQLDKARQEKERFAQLVADGAANRKLLDDANNEVRILEKQLDAQLSTLNTSASSLEAQMGTSDAQKLEVADNLRRCHVLSPIGGTILAKYAERGEYATVGKPLFKVADLCHMTLRAYVTANQLQQVKIGNKVTVFADYGSGDRQQYKGTVAWISAKSEFTPKTIMTDDERADLVYAVKIRVDNADGLLKIGMYGEVKL